MYQSNETLINEFDRLFYHSETWGSGHTKWMGVDAWKYPTDLIMYQMLIHETRPDLIIECGTGHGGSALFFAHMLDLIEQEMGMVVTIDPFNPGHRPTHSRIRYLGGSSLDPEIVDIVKSYIGAGERVMVVLDSDHNCEHVLKEMEIYGQFVTPGCYMIVEDGNLDSLGLIECGPSIAIRRFLEDHPEFMVHVYCERYLLTANPNGYLRRLNDHIRD